MSKGKRPHDLEQNPFVLGVFFALRAIRIISAIKATERIHIAIRSFLFPHRKMTLPCIDHTMNRTDYLRYRQCIHPYTRIVFLQIFSIKCSGKFFSFQCFRNVSITRNTSINFIWPLPYWGPFAEFRILSFHQQNQFPH